MRGLLTAGVEGIRRLIVPQNRAVPTGGCAPSLDDGGVGRFTRPMGPFTVSSSMKSKLTVERPPISESEPVANCEMSCGVLNVNSDRGAREGASAPCISKTGAGREASMLIRGTWVGHTLCEVVPEDLRRSIDIQRPVRHRHVLGNLGGREKGRSPPRDPAHLNFSESSLHWLHLYFIYAQSSLLALLPVSLTELYSDTERSIHIRCPPKRLNVCFPANPQTCGV